MKNEKLTISIKNNVVRCHLSKGGSIFSFMGNAEEVYEQAKKEYKHVSRLPKERVVGGYAERKVRVKYNKYVVAKLMKELNL